MTPDERRRVHEDRTVTDLSQVPPGLLERLLGDGEEIVSRGEQIRDGREAAERIRRRAS